MKLPELKTTRLLRGMTQPELAEASGVSMRTIVNEEHGGEARPSTARKLAEALDVSVAVLAGVEAFPTARRDYVPELVPLQIAEMFEASPAARRRALGAASATEIERYLAEVEEHKERSEAEILNTADEANSAREELRSGYESSIQQLVTYVYRLGQMHAEAESHLPTHASVA